MNLKEFEKKYKRIFEYRGVRIREDSIVIRHDGISSEDVIYFNIRFIKEDNEIKKVKYNYVVSCADHIVRSNRRRIKSFKYSIDDSKEDNEHTFKVLKY